MDNVIDRREFLAGATMLAAAGSVAAAPQIKNVRIEAWFYTHTWSHDWHGHRQLAIDRKSIKDLKMLPAYFMWLGSNPEKLIPVYPPNVRPAGRSNSVTS